MQTHILTKYNKIRFCTVFQWIWRRSTPNSLNCYFGTCFGNIGSLWHCLSKLSKNTNFREVLYVLIKSRMRVRMNPHSIVTWMSRNSLLEAGVKTHNTAQSFGQFMNSNWLCVWIQLQSLKLQVLCLLRARSSLTFRKLQSVDSLWHPYVTW